MKGLYEVISLPKCVKCGHYSDPMYRVSMELEASIVVCVRCYTGMTKEHTLIPKYGVEPQPLPIQSNFRMGEGVATRADKKEQESKILPFVAKSLLDLLDQPFDSDILPELPDIVESVTGTLLSDSQLSSTNQILAWLTVDNFRYSWRIRKFGQEVVVEDITTGTSRHPTIESWTRLKCALDTKHYTHDVVSPNSLNYPKMSGEPVKHIVKVWKKSRKLFVLAWCATDQFKKRDLIEVYGECEHCQGVGQPTIDIWLNKQTGEEKLICHDCGTTIND